MKDRFCVIRQGFPGAGIFNATGSTNRRARSAILKIVGLLNWRNRSQYRVEEVPVPAHAVADGATPYDLPMYVSMFVSHALRSAMYRHDELPREALLASHVFDYMGEVNNGGHAQFVGNTGWDPDFRADVREGLAVLGLDEAARIFADLEAFAKAEPQRFRHIGGMGSAALANLFRPGSEPETIDPYFHELDDRFYKGVGESIPAVVSAWLRTRPWLRVLPDAEYTRIRGWKIPDHPLRDVRFEAWRRRSKVDAFLARIREYLHPRG
jgi:hypothetical protein